MMTKEMNWAPDTSSESGREEIRQLVSRCIQSGVIRSGGMQSPKNIESQYHHDLSRIPTVTTPLKPLGPQPQPLRFPADTSEPPAIPRIHLTRD